MSFSPPRTRSRSRVLAAYPTPPSQPSALRQLAGNVISARAQAALMNAGPYGRAAVGAYRIGRYVYNRVRQAQANRERTAPRRTLQFAGRYSGKFRKPKKTKKMSMAKKLGVVLSQEIYGKVDDPDMVVVGQHTFPKGQIAKALAYSILRKAIKKAIGFDATDIEQEIPFTDYNDAQKGRVKFVYKDPTDGTIKTASFDVVNNDTISSCASKACSGDFTVNFITQLENLMTEGTTESIYDLQRVIVSNITASTAIVLCDLNMLNEVVKVSVGTNIKMQNRTLASSAADASTDRVDTQPIKGRLLQFKGVPQPLNMHEKSGLYNGVMNAGSVVLIRGAELDGGSEPRVKQDFSNCYRSSSISLQPGEIKSTKIGQKHAAYFNNLMKYIRHRGNNSLYTSHKGYCQLAFFEEVLNSGSSNKITINYEQQLYISSYLITGKGSPINTEHNQAEQNNVTPA